MLEALCSIGFFSGFIQFLKVAVFAVGYISGSNLFPEPLTAQEEKIYLEQLKSGDEKYINRKKLKISCTCCEKVCKYKSRTR